MSSTYLRTSNGRAQIVGSVLFVSGKMYFVKQENVAYIFTRPNALQHANSDFVKIDT